MANAQAVWYRLVSDLLDRGSSAALETAECYLGTVFQLSALLHDIGHCAFSHSSEKVKVGDGAPLFGTVAELFKRWGEPEMLAKLLAKEPSLADKRAKHEEIGLALIAKLFKSEPRIGEACKELSTDAESIKADVLAVLNDAFTWTATFAEHSEVFCRALSDRGHGTVDAEDATPRLREILHGLVSGTLDVDRMDYLLRDALFCGVPYGKYDREVLIGSLEIAPDADQLFLTLDAKAAYALDDLLWSRYQMFIQVYNHKTNVVMDHMLGAALAWAIKQGHLRRPQTHEECVAFTDDQVMGTVFDLCSRAEGARESPFGQTLTRRSVPKHFGSAALQGSDDATIAPEVEQLRVAKEAEVGVAVLALQAGSDLIKTEVPSLRTWDKVACKLKLEAFANRSSILQARNFKASHRVVHFFADSL
jgi:HD superfamily phosphohydrolase